MELTVFLLSVLAVSQVSTGSESAPVAAPGDSPPAASRPEGDPDGVAKDPPSEGESRHGEVEALAEEILRDALARRAAMEPDAAELGLRQAIAQSLVREDRIATVRAYWKLAAAQLELIFAQDDAAFLEDLKIASGDSGPRLRAAAATASAGVSAAAIDEQHAHRKLAERVSSRPDQPLLIAVEMPHVDRYRTEFEAIFGGSAAPPAIYLLDRTLPIRKDEIDARVGALEAAVDARTEAQRLFLDEGIGSLEIVLACAGHAARQKSAFAQSVLNYNLEIASYASHFAHGGVDDATLLGMLVRSAPEGGGAASPTLEGNSGVERAGFIENRGASPPVRQYGEPTPAEPPTGPTTGTSDTKQPGEFRPGDPQQWRAVPPETDNSEEGTEPPSEESDEQANEEPAPPEVGLRGRPSRDFAVAARTVAFRRQALSVRPAIAGLAPLGGPERSQRLARLIPASSTLSGTAPIGLEECLVRVSHTSRAAMIDTYWEARERAALCALYRRQQEQFHALVGRALEARHEPGGPAQMARLDAMRQAALADQLRAEAELAIAQFALTTARGAPVDGPWPLPETAPHGGRYRLRLEQQPREIAQSTHVIQLASQVPQLYQLLENSATAVIELAAAAEADDAAGIDEAMQLLVDQAHATRAFVAHVARYNRAIAGYALAVLPADVDSSLLARALVVSGSRRGPSS